MGSPCRERSLRCVYHWTVGDVYSMIAVYVASTALLDVCTIGFISRGNRVSLTQSAGINPPRERCALPVEYLAKPIHSSPVPLSPPSYFSQPFPDASLSGVQPLRPNDRVPCSPPFCVPDSFAGPRWRETLSLDDCSIVIDLSQWHWITEVLYETPPNRLVHLMFASSTHCSLALLGFVLGDCLTAWEVFPAPSKND